MGDGRIWRARYALDRRGRGGYSCLGRSTPESVIRKNHNCIFGPSQGALLERGRQRSPCRAADGRQMVIAMNQRIMGRLTLPRPMLVVGWLATAVMALATAVFFLI